MHAAFRDFPGIPVLTTARLFDDLAKGRDVGAEKALTDWIKSQPGIVLTKEERRYQLIQSIVYLVAAGVVLAAIVIYMYNIAHYGH